MNKLSSDLQIFYVYLEITRKNPLINIVPFYCAKKNPFILGFNEMAREPPAGKRVGRALARTTFIVKHRASFIFYNVLRIADVTFLIVVPG